MKDFRNLEFGDYLRIFWRRKWYFLATAALVTAGVFVYAWRQPMIYRSETRILVEPPPVPDDLVRSTVRATPEDRINSIRAQVQSRSFIERTVEQYQLYGYGGPGFSMERAVDAVRNNIRISVSLENTFTLSFVAADPQAARDITQRLAEMLVEATSAMRRNQAVVADQFIDEQLRKAERELMANEDQLKAFKQQHLGALPEQSAANVSALNGLMTQLSAVESALERAADRRKLLDFRAQEQRRLAVLSHSLMTPEVAAPKPAAVQKPVSPQEAQLAAKRNLLAELKAKYTENHPDVVRVAREVEDLDRKLAAGRAAASVQAASAEQTDLTPLGAPDSPTRDDAGGASIAPGQFDAILDVSEDEIRTEAKSIEQEISKLERQRDDVRGQIKVIQGRLNMAPALEQELLSLSRDHDVLLQRYNNLQAKKFSTQIATTLETRRNTEFYRIIDPATLPERPAFPNRTQMILMGIGAGLMLGIGAAFGREYLDPTLGSEIEAVTALKLPVLASVPEIPGKRGKGGPAKRIKSAA